MLVIFLFLGVPAAHPPAPTALPPLKGGKRRRRGGRAIRCSPTACGGVASTAIPHANRAPLHS